MKFNTKHGADIQTKHHRYMYIERVLSEKCDRVTHNLKIICIYNNNFIKAKVQNDIDHSISTITYIDTHIFHPQFTTLDSLLLDK